MSPTESIPPLPHSPLYQLLDTPTSGRGVFASTNIPINTLVLSTSTSTSTNLSHHELQPDTSPLAWLIQRPYRKETCANCFSYNRGRDWKLKVTGRDCGVVFCCESCHLAWVARNGELGVQAWEALESGVKAISKRSININFEETDTDADSSDGGGNDSKSHGPSDEDIKTAWDHASLSGEVVINARTKAKPSKIERRVLGNVVDDGGDPDLMYYLLTAVLSAHKFHMELKAQKAESTLEECIGQITLNNNSDISPTSSATPMSYPSTPSSNYSPNHELSATHPDIRSLLAPLFTLTSTSTAYAASHTSLSRYTSSCLYLLSVLPLPLTPYLTPLLAHSLNTHAAHNAFSIRPSTSTAASTPSNRSTATNTNSNTSDGPDSGEFLGWAVFPTASFFNHSCAPNLRKQRSGRVFEFHTSRDVEVGEELSISYLGGDEEELDVVKRRERLKGEWGFECACVRCSKEA